MCYIIDMKEKMLNVYGFLKKPSLLFKIVSYVLFFLFTGVAFLCLGLGVNQNIMTIFYSVMGVTFFYDCYLFIVYDYKSIRNTYRVVKVRLSKTSKFVNRLINDMYFRTMFTSSFSTFFGLGFVAYNAFIGLYYHSIWNGSISIYYMFLVIIRGFFLYGEYKIIKSNGFSDQNKDLKRAKMFRFEGSLLLCLNVALIAPVTLLALSKKEVNLPMWVAIANAAYTFYKITMCCVSFAKSRKNNVLSVRGLKNLNLIDACVSLLSLENTMIITFSDGVNDLSMHTLMIVSSLVITILNIGIAIFTLKKGKEEVLLQENIIGGMN